MSDLSYLARLTNNREIKLIESEVKDNKNNKITKIEDTMIKMDADVYSVLKKQWRIKKRKMKQ